MQLNTREKKRRTPTGLILSSWPLTSYRLFGHHTVHSHCFLSTFHRPSSLPDIGNASYSLRKLKQYKNFCRLPLPYLLVYQPVTFLCYFSWILFLYEASFSPYTLLSHLKQPRKLLQQFGFLCWCQFFTAAFIPTSILIFCYFFLPSLKNEREWKTFSLIHFVCGQLSPFLFTAKYFEMIACNHGLLISPVPFCQHFTNIILFKVTNNHCITKSRGHYLVIILILLISATFDIVDHSLNTCYLLDCQETAFF